MKNYLQSRIWKKKGQNKGVKNKGDNKKRMKQHEMKDYEGGHTMSR